VSIVRDFTAHSGLPPWLWDEDAFDAWCDHLGLERNIAVSSQRHYQGAIRTFLDYICQNVGFRNEIRRAYNIEPRQICTEENCIPHTVEREITQERTALTHQQIETLFDGLKLAAQEAHKFRSKDFRPLQRDRALFFTIYAGGLRISEALGLNVESFDPNPHRPELGKYGFVKVWGKGSRGSGPRFRSVPVTHADLPPILEWYQEKVRPHFLDHADPNEKALFLSERGNRLCISLAEYRFQKALVIAGLDGLGFTPHCLRHSSVTHESLRFSMEAVRRKHGHSSSAVTQTYMHVPDEMVDEEISRVVGNQLDELLK
jgi:site-specific recombinase XerD